MNRVFLTSLLTGVLAAMAWAQEGADSPEQRGERRWRGGPDRSMWADRMFTRIADELDLDEEQRTQFDEITAEHRERMRESGRRWMEVRQAMRDGDEERAAELRAELREWRGAESGISEVLDEIEPILRDDQVGRLWEIQDRMQRGRDHRERYSRIVRELPDELELDEEQRGEFSRLLAARREQMRERWAERRPLMQQMREAHEAGDEERVAELRRQLEESRPDPATMFAAFFEQLKDILTEEQQVRLAAYRERLETGGRDERRGPGDLRNVLRVAKRLRLSSEQKGELKDIEREAIGAYRKTGRRDREGQARLAAKVKEEIVQMLDAEQVEQFEEQLQRFERRNRRQRDG